MNSYRVVLQRTVITHEFFIVQGDDEDEAVENAQGGAYPAVAVDIQESSTETMTVEEMN